MGIHNKYFSGNRLKAVEKNLRALLEKHKGKGLPSEELFIDTHNFLTLFQIDKATLRRWRQQKLLPFTKIGGKYFFKIRDIREFLEKNS